MCWKEARNLLQHELPARDLVEVQRRALELLVHELRKRKYAASERSRRTAAKPARDAQPLGSSPTPQEAPPPEPKFAPARPAEAMLTAPDRHVASKSAQQSRYIPAEVRRAVWQRDQARCTYADLRGQRCREQAGLEFHHQHPHARGGPPRADNLTLRCRSHNALAAEQDFGRELIREKRTAVG